MTRIAIASMMIAGARPMSALAEGRLARATMHIVFPDITDVLCPTLSKQM